MGNKNDKFGFSDSTAVDLDGGQFADDGKPKKPAAGAPKKPPAPMSADAVAGRAQGTIRQDAPPSWDDDEEDGNEKTSALDISALNLPGLGNLDAGDDEPEQAEERTMATGTPAFVEEEERIDPNATMAMEFPRIPGAPPPAPPPPMADDDDEAPAESTMAMDPGAILAKGPPPKPAPPPQRQAPPPPLPPPAPPRKAPPPPPMDSGDERTQMADPSTFAPKGGRAPAPPPEDERTKMADAGKFAPKLNVPAEANVDSTMMFDASALLAPRDDAGPQGVLTIMGGNDQGKEFFLRGDSTMIGRGLDCDVVLNDPSVSRRHFRIDRRKGDYYLVDLGSGNGTKVNGVRVSDHKLIEGAQLECGTSVLSFGYAGSEARAPQDVQIEVKKAGAGLKFMVAFLVLGALGGGVYFGGAWMGWWANFVPPPPEAPVATEDAGPTKAELLLLESSEQIGKKKLDAALKTLEEAAAEGADGAAVKRFRARIKDARKHKELIAQQEKVIEKGDFQEAIRTLETVPTTSPYFTDADAMKDIARNKLVRQWKDKAYDFQDKGQNKEAVKLLALVLRENPDDHEALEAKTELDGKPDAPPPGTVVAEVKPAEGTQPAAEVKPAEVKPAEGTQPAAEVKPAEVRPAEVKPAEGTQPTAEVKPAEVKPAEVKPTEVKPAEGTQPAAEVKPAVAVAPAPVAPEFEHAPMRGGYRLYGAGKFEEAATYFERLGRNKKYYKKERGRAEALAADVREFGDAYEKANAAAKSFQPATAIPLLEKAKKLDAGIQGSYGGEIRRQLATMYAFRAAGAYSGLKYKEAAELARKALSYNPGESGAQLIYEKIEGKIESLMAQARSAKASANTERASSLLRTVIGILPGTDPRYREAAKMLADLEAEKANQDDD